jgi:Zn-dependent metalloprotease
MTKFGKEVVKSSLQGIGFIISPYKHEEIATKGNREEGQRALCVLELSKRARSVREVAGSLPAMVITIEAQKRRTIFDGPKEQVFPRPRLKRGEGDPSTNHPAVDEVSDHSGLIYDFYKDLFERNPIDDNGMRLDSTVYYNIDYEGAYWSENHMAYEDGSTI